MKKISVIQVIDSLNAGGAEVLAVNIANALAEKGISSHICTTRKEGVLRKSISKNVSYFFLQRTSTIDIKAIFRFRRYIKDNNIRIIHAHTTSCYFIYQFKIMYPSITTVWHNHTGAYVSLMGLKKILLKEVIKKFNLIINVNKALNNWSKYELKKEASFYLNNFAVFKNQTKVTTLQGVECKRIVHLAGFRPQKDHINLLKAFSLIQNKHSDWTLHLVGKDYKDNYSKNIQDYLNENNLTDKVFFYGVCTDIKNILHQSTIGVLSSKSEGLPVSLLEYGLAKLPIVVTDVGECKKVINEPKVIVEAENSKELASAINYLIENIDERNNIAKSFHKKICNEYSEESVILKLISIYKEIC